MGARMKLGVGTALLVALVVGCGGGGGKATPREYVAAICTEVTAWTQEVEGLSTEIDQKLTAEATPAEGQAALAVFLDDVLASTDDHLGGVRDAGIPDVEGGEDVAGSVVEAFEDAKAVLEDARDKVDELPTGDAAAFGAATQELGSSIQSALGGIGGSLGGLESPELSRAAQEEPACAPLAG